MTLVILHVVKLQQIDKTDHEPTKYRNTMEKTCNLFILPQSYVWKHYKNMKFILKFSSILIMPFPLFSFCQVSLPIPLKKTLSCWCSYLCLASSNCSLWLLYNDLLGLALLPLYLHSLPTLNLNLTWLDQLNLWKKESERNINYASYFSLLGLSITKSSLRMIYCCKEKETTDSSLFSIFK